MLRDCTVTASPESRRTANPINPDAKPRGIVNADVYARLRQWDANGLHEIDCDEIELLAGYRPTVGAQPSGQQAALLLLLEADCRDWTAESADERQARIKAARQDGRIDDAEHDRRLHEMWTELETQPPAKPKPRKWRTPPFRPQLGKLAEQAPRERERTIADWRRNARTYAAPTQFPLGTDIFGRPPGQVDRKDTESGNSPITRTHEGSS